MIKDFINKCNIKEQVVCSVNSRLYSGLNTIEDSILLFISSNDFFNLVDNILNKNIEFLIIEDVESSDTFSNYKDLIKSKFEIKLYDPDEKVLLFENTELRKTLIDETGFWKTDNENDHSFDESLCLAISKLCENKTIADLGCGNGAYVEFLNNSNVKTVGYDGNPTVVTKPNCLELNLTKSNKIKKTFDVVMCLEVGEHIPEKYEDILINNIIKFSKKTIILSWAIPGQGGFGHVNCKPNDYIISKIEEKGFKYDQEKSQELRDAASRDWFKNTIMLFNKVK